jgi:deoxyribonuclease V
LSKEYLLVIISLMKIKNLPNWNLSPSEAIELQKRLAGEVIRESSNINPRYIAGADISVRLGEKTATAVVVILSYPELEIIETRVVRGELDFPYIPGLLSFRELPLTLAAFEKLRTTPDLVFVDGQGIAHPRRIGIASHLGLCLDIPTIGCAKSLLCGECGTPGGERGNYSEIIDKGETIGAALRTRTGVKPVYISTGHKISLEDAISWAMKCGRGYRIPEPTRQAHMAVKTAHIVSDPRN